MSILPAQFDLIIYKGVDFSESWIFSDETGNLTDLTGAAATLNMYTQADYPTPFVSLTTDNHSINFSYQDSILSVATAFLAGSATDDLPVQCGFYNFEIISPGGYINRFLQGCVSVQV
jgi:hypothetical protein